jgi:DNA repair protein RadC
VVGLTKNLLSAFNTLEKLNQATGTEMCQIKAIGATKALQTKAPLEVEKRIASKPTRVKIKLKSSQAFAENLFSNKTEYGFFSFSDESLL